MRIRNEEERRRANRDAKRRQRDREKDKSKPQAGEQAYEKALENGASEAELDKIVESSLPEKKREGYDIAKVTVGELPPSFVEDIKPALQKAMCISSPSNEAAKMHTQPEVVNEVALSQEEEERPWHFENGKKVYD